MPSFYLLAGRGFSSPAVPGEGADGEGHSHGEQVPLILDLLLPPGASRRRVFFEESENLRGRDPLDPFVLSLHPAIGDPFLTPYVSAILGIILFHTSVLGVVFVTDSTSLFLKPICIIRTLLLWLSTGNPAEVRVRVLTVGREGCPVAVLLRQVPHRRWGTERVIQSLCKAEFP